MKTEKDLEPPKTAGASRHTPTPWQIRDLQDDCLDIIRPWEDGKVHAGSHPTFGSGHGAHIATIHYHSTGGVATKEQAQVNAEFIVRAVNCHDELVAALRGLLEPIGYDNAPDDAAWNRAEDALAKAQARSAPPSSEGSNNG